MSRERSGWIRLHRILMKKAIWKCSKSPQKVILITILLMANWEQNQWVWKGKKYECQPGEFITSLKSIAEEAGESIQSVRTALSNFAKKYDFLTYTSTKISTKIVIKNWYKYQLNDQNPEKDQQSDQQSDQQRTNTEPTHNEELKEIKEIKEITPPTPPKGEKPKKKKAKKVHEPIPEFILTDVQIDQEAFLDFYDYRLNSKKPMKGKAFKLAYDLLVKYNHATQRKVIDRSILSGWQGLFEPDKKDIVEEEFDPYQTKLWKDRMKEIDEYAMSDAGRKSARKAQKKLDKMFEDMVKLEPEPENLSPEERKAQCLKLKKEVIRKLSI